MKKKTFNQEQIEVIKEILKTSHSLAQVLKALNLQPEGGNYRTLKRFIKENDLDVSHLTGKGWNTGSRSKICNPAKPLIDILKKNTRYPSHKLKQRLIKDGFKEHKCENCNLTHWLDNLIPIELDHIDGDHDNNELSNLRILCPNCHSLTPTYRGKNIKSTYVKEIKKLEL
jgi:5-methylcytosine-specific restriction endonuclease McrA